METKFRADDVVVCMPLFHNGRGGSIPTSALQLNIAPIGRDTFMPLNEAWHSRLPECKNAFEGFFFGAEFEDRFYAVSWWSKPVARTFNGKSWLELRRMAIHDNAPKNTASRMLKIMRLWIQKNKPSITNLISYQDTEVHTGTIYKASGWKQTARSSVSTKGWTTRGSNRKNQSTADKIRWEYRLAEDAVNPITAEERVCIPQKNMDMFALGA